MHTNIVDGSQNGVLIESLLAHVGEVVDHLHGVVVACEAEALVVISVGHFAVATEVGQLLLDCVDVIHEVRVELRDLGNDLERGLRHEATSGQKGFELLFCLSLVFAVPRVGDPPFENDLGHLQTRNCSIATTVIPFRGNVWPPLNSSTL